jgi:hypothetical protein
LYTATERPAGIYACPEASEAGSLTRNRLEGEGNTAAFGRRIAPKNANSSAAAADHQAASPRKSRRGIIAGSRRDRGTAAGFGSVVMYSSTPFEN